MTSDHKTRRRRSWTAGGVFVMTWIAVIVLALMLVGLGIQFAGGAAAFRGWLDSMTFYTLLWRVGVYVVGGTLYIKRFRPRLRAMQRQQSDGGDAAHTRLIKIEQLLLIVLVVIEAANLPDLIGWIRG